MENFKTDKNKKICKKCGEYKHDCICDLVYTELKQEQLINSKSASREAKLIARVESLEKAIGFACHLLALGITGYRDKKETPEETLLENVDRATKEHARIRSPNNDCLSDYEFRSLVIWMKDKKRKPADTAFTSGACRDAAIAFEIARG